MRFDEPEQYDRDTQPLQESLRELYHADSPLSREVDRRVLAKAEKQLRGVRNRQMWRRWAGVAAAAVLIFGFMTYWNNNRETAEKPLVAASPYDMDANGKTNILDAFLLARSIEKAEVKPARGDINQDGRIDQMDVDLIAMEAVKLETTVAYHIPADLNTEQMVWIERPGPDGSNLQ